MKDDKQEGDVNPKSSQKNSTTAVVNLGKRVNKSEGPVRTAPVWISMVKQFTIVQ